MKDTALYEQLLGLKTPWSVKKVDLSLADQRVVAEVVLKKGQVWADPTDATKRTHVTGWSERQWRHLDTCQFETIIKARVPQLKYSDGTAEELTLPWAERYSRVTTMIAGFVPMRENIWRREHHWRTRHCQGIVNTAARQKNRVNDGENLALSSFCSVSIKCRQIPTGYQGIMGGYEV